MHSDRPLLVWDAECDFCRRWIERWQRLTGDRVEYAPHQQVAASVPGIPLADFQEAVHLREPDGTWTRGAEAVWRTLAYAPGGGVWRSLYEHVPPFAAASEAFYRLVAKHRPLFLRLTKLVWGEHVVPPGERTTIAIFLRGFGLVSFAAFASLAVQVVGLVGREGVLPAAEFLAAVRAQYGPGVAWALPTLAWLNASDTMLQALAWGGAAASLVLTLGFLPGPSLVAILVGYVSLTTIGRDFLLFQWDGLLIETALVALFLTPWRRRLSAARDPEPPRSSLALVRWLLFRLMFSSAVVKLASGDPTWRHLTALTFHYQTQPLPTWTAWWAHHLSAGFQAFSARGMFVAEGLAPFLVLAPRRLRFLGAFTMIGLQVLIAATGNYGFFNALAILLCIPLFDDGFWPRGFAPRIDAPVAARPRSRSRAHRFLRRPLVIAIFLVGLVPLWGSLAWPMRALGPLPFAYGLLAPFRVVNPYGLFAVMTTERREIVLEGSDDGVMWRAYEFRWKPGSLERRPEFTGPHMPRLDWQMWFAALGGPRENAWLLYLCHRLLEGSRPVIALFGANPFPQAPPRFVRATFWRYRFSTATERRTTHAWWVREPLGLYLPPLVLVDGRLAPAGETPEVRPDESRDAVPPDSIPSRRTR